MNRSSALPQATLWKIIALNLLFFLLPFTIRLILPISAHFGWAIHSGITTRAISAIYLISLFFIPLINFFATLHISNAELQDENISNGGIYRRALTVAFFSFYIYLISLRVVTDGDKAIDLTALNLVNPIMMFIIAFYFGGGVTKDILAAKQSGLLPGFTGDSSLQSLKINATTQKTEQKTEILKNDPVPA